MRAEFYESGNLDGHMALVRKACERSLLDPETVQLAGKILSNVVDYVDDPQTGRKVSVIVAWGHYFWPSGLQTPPAKDDSRELQMIWAFIVRNIRYVYDPEHADTFKTLKQSLLSHAGDCDDMAIAFCALARAVGFTSCWARVISMSGESWEHVYPIVGCPKENPTIHIPFEMTVAGTAPGVEVSGYREHRDFQMSSG